MEVYVKNKFGIASKVEKQEQQSIEESVTVMQENSNFPFLAPLDSGILCLQNACL